MSFEYEKLENVCEILDSQRVPITEKDRKPGIYPYYGANGVQDYIDDFIFDDELVLLAEDGGNFGSKDKPIAYRVSGKCWVNNHAHVLKAKDNIDIDYLCYSLMFYNTNGFVNGATRQKLTQIAMRQMLIPLRKKDVQLKIVKKINLIFQLIGKRKQQLSKLDQLVKSRFVEMFGECKTNPKNWKLLNMEDVAVVGSSKRVFVEELQEDGIPFYRGTEVGALAEGKNIVPELYIKEDHYKELVKATGIPQPGDLLMPSICPDGRIWVVNTENPFYFKDGRVLWIHNIDTKFNSTFLLYTLKDRIVADYLSIASGTTFAELKIFTLKKCKIFSVPLPLQEQFAAFVQQVDKAKSSVKQSLEKLETLKKSLMQEYFG
jgi:type I restriction enzyme S subunit